MVIIFFWFFFLLTCHFHSIQENQNGFTMHFIDAGNQRNESIMNQPMMHTSSIETESIPVSLMSNGSMRLIPVSEVPYIPPKNRSHLYAGNIVAWSWGITMGDRLKKLGVSPITINIDASFKESRYFVIPNIKGLCNRLQIFTGVYILSSYYHIPVIISKSMLWRELWNLKEMFPGQFIEIPDSGIGKVSE